MSVTSSTKRTLDSLPREALEGLRAVVRVDFNVPVHDGKITDYTRINAALPTIAWLQACGARVVLLSHFGRPKGQPMAQFSLAPVAQALEPLLGMPVSFIPDLRAASAVSQTRRLKRGAVALAENTRFIEGEEENTQEAADLFASLGDFYVNDAFGAAHRAHASTAGVAERLSPAVAGLSMAKELQYLGEALDDPKRPFVAVLGGAKISGKIDVIEALLPKVDAILIGGAMACTFFAAMGLETGDSLLERGKVDIAARLLKIGGEKLHLPAGATIARGIESGAATRDVNRDEIPTGWGMYDIDTNSAQQFTDIIRGAATVIWNGPMGVFETPPFDAGTKAIAVALAEATALGATTIVGGGDSAAALRSCELTDRVTHVSTGGGASLEFLEGKALPGICSLDDA